MFKQRLLHSSSPSGNFTAKWAPSRIGGSHCRNYYGPALSKVVIPLNPYISAFDNAQTLEEAAALAIYYSQARGSSQVPVDYTHVKQIKKPNSAKPGMVIYDQNWTLYLTPKPETLERLLTSEELSSTLS